MRVMAESGRGSSSDSGAPGAVPAAAARRLSSLFDELAAGRTEALEGVWEICSDRLYGLALWRTGSAADAADAVQDVFVRLAGIGPGLRRVRDPLAYLSRMAHRAAIDVHRRRSRRREEPISECPLLEAPDESPDRRLEARRMSRLLMQLPTAQREAIYLREFAGCSFAEIGRATGVPTFTAASRYRLGLRRLKSLAGVPEGGTK